jgi:hypothetical protein
MISLAGNIYGIALYFKAETNGHEQKFLRNRAEKVSFYSPSRRQLLSASGLQETGELKMRTSMAVLVAIAITMTPVASFAAAAPITAATPKAATTTATATTTPMAKVMTKADRCSALEVQYDDAAKLHMKSKNITKAAKLRADAGKLCSSRRFTSGILKLKSGLTLLGVKPA